MTPRERKSCDAMKLALYAISASQPLSSQDRGYVAYRNAKAALEEALADYFGSERQDTVDRTDTQATPTFGPQDTFSHDGGAPRDDYEPGLSDFVYRGPTTKGD